MTDKRVKKLETNRKSVTASLIRIQSYIHETEGGEIEELTNRYATLSELWSKYDLCQTELEEIDFDTYGGDRGEFEKTFYSVKSIIEKAIKAEDAQYKSGVEDKKQNFTNEGHSRVILPQLDIPKFYGNYKHWLGFRDLFESLIHTNKKLSEMEKFHYLKTSLSGEALQEISSIVSSAQSYAVAWKALNKRYNNKSFIVNSHLEAIFDQPQITKESVSSLRKLITQTRQNLGSLECQGLPVKEWDAIIIFMLKRKLDGASRREWELNKNWETSNKLPTLDEFLTFVEKRCFSLEALQGGSNVAEYQSQERPIKDKRSKMSHVVSEHQQNCKLCNSQHILSQCDTFLNLNTNERIDAVKKFGLCFNCLKANHSADRCKSTFTCKKCKRKHHTLIHFENMSENASTSNAGQNLVQDNIQESSQTEAKSNCTFYNMSQRKEVLLATAVIKIQNSSGQWQVCRTLLDSGSQTNFIAKGLFQRLGFKSKPKNCPINGINQIKTKINKSVDLTITSRVGTYQRRLEFLILDNITNELPTRFIDYRSWRLPQGISLADPEFNIPGQVEMLLGAEIFFDILFNEQLRLGNNLPIIQNTEFGWLISGRTFSEQGNKSESCYFSAEALDSQLRKFWEVEEVHKDIVLSAEERACEEHFEANTTRDKIGQFIVKLPFKQDPNILGDSYNTALRRFNHLEKKFTFNEALKVHYTQFMNEYIKLGHMKEANEDDKSSGYYLPHHAILKESSLTTKIRVVFDASAATSNGISLNDILMVGPTIQQDLFAILCRFRTHTFVLTADIEKMYRQIRVHEDDLIYQKILWRQNPDEELKTYLLNTVTYGTASAPFSAVRCLHQLAEVEATNFPQACNVLKRDFYIDDLLTGGDDLEATGQLKADLVTVLERGGFKLRKWLSNDQRLLLEASDISRDPLLHLDISQTVKTLGLYWNAQSDVILYIAKLNTQNGSPTKRNLLSQIAKLFDPLGLLGPVICKAKITMQELWQLKAGWDDQVPEHISQIWNEYKSQLKFLNDLEIPRRVLIKNPIKLQLHGFCDASEVSYGACIYIRSSDGNDNHMMRLVCSKSRVAPLKRISLPRLELCAALLLANLYSTVVKALNLEFDNIFLWSDSTVTLYWINTPPHKLKTFVANRISEIQGLTIMRMWNHINSNENPADILSRGCLAEQLIHSDIWWNGPSWIIKDEQSWPKQEFRVTEDPSEVSEFKTINTSCHVAVKAFKLFEQFSNLTKLQRVTAYCLRFINNVKPHHKKQTGPLLVTELKTSLRILIKISQQESYSADISSLQNHNSVPPGSQLKSLYPFLDQEGIIRVGGRLENLNALFEQKHQIILPPRHILTKLIVQNEHLKLLHAGTQAVLNSIRQNYWPINGRNLIKAIIHKCHKCFRFRMAQIERNQLMGNLPQHRIQLTRPFLNSGVDYGGPLLIKQGSQRRPTITKAYIALFVCMATKAIHLELVSSLSTADFLSAFRRFTARRGKCANIYSDNGTNFKGADHELQNFLKTRRTKDEIRTATATEGVQWHFIPPNSPNFGGLWEAGIKSVKYHIKRVIGETKLSFEEMYTLLVQIEACVNSRPLTPIYDDPTDVSPLTPAHFLIGSPLTELPDQNVTDTPTNRLSRWQVVQQMSQHFWKRWSMEYLHHLQQRSRWTQATANLRVNDMVLLKESNCTPLQWKIARVMEVHPGSDNLVRVATVRTSSGLLKRPISKLCLLPKEE